MKTYNEDDKIKYDFEEDENEDVEPDNDYIQHFSKIINFRKIKAIKFSDSIIKEKFQFKSVKDFYNFKNVNEAAFEADYSLHYLLYKYTQKYKIIPKYLIIRKEIIGEKFFDKFYENVRIPKECYNFNHTYDDRNIKLDHFIILIEKIILYFDGYDSYLIYPEEFLKDKKSSLYILLGIIKAYKNPQIIKNKIYVVFQTQHGLEKKSFNVKKRKINLQENYNDGFEKISEEIILKLNDKKKTGLVILHGEPGTGKTTFLRYLAGKLKRNIIFISPDMVHHITSPEFIPFLLDNSNSILIIEDAESALQKRIDDRKSGAVSNILNMTDGLLSDCLNISVVTTFNTTMKDIDEALLRKGRLLRSYKFEKLEISKAQILMKKLGREKKVKESMTLADIYFYEDEKSGLEFNYKKSGFVN